MGRFAPAPEIVAMPHLEVRVGAVSDADPTVVTVLAPFHLDEPDEPLGASTLDELVGLRPESASIRAAHAPDGRGEVVVVGSCYAPEGRHVTACLVRLRCGSIDKSVYVSGDRFWHGSVATDPQPFRVMPVDPRHAFGGSGSKRNPAGKGLSPFEVDGVRVHPFPNIQPPGHLVMAPGDTTPLAGLGPLPVRALPDQRLDRPLQPAEPFVVDHMHPLIAELRGTLPTLVLRCFAERGMDTDEGELEEVGLAFESAWLFPAEQRGVAVHRGWLDAPDEANATRAVVVATEARDAPVDLARYRAAWRRGRGEARHDPGAWWPWTLDPASLASRAPEPGARHVERAKRQRDELANDLRAQEASTREEVASRLAAMGRAGDDVLPREPIAVPDPPPRETAIDVRARLEVQRAKTERRIVEQLAATGIDPRPALGAAPSPGGPPPRFSARAQLDRVRSALARAAGAGTPADAIRERVDDPSLAARLHAGEALLAAHYRRSAHRHPAFMRDPGRAAELRDRVVRARAAGESLAGSDLAGADLGGLDLAGADLKGTLLECARLRGAKLEGADLTRSVLAHADLEEADLRGCKLVDANLGLANLRRARLARADLTGAVLVGAEIAGADREGATWPADPHALIATTTELEARAAEMPSPEDRR